MPNQTAPTDASIAAFLAQVPEESRRDSDALLEMMRAASKSEPKMWGPAIVGFDTYRYRYANGKPGEICLIGFSPRKNGFALYGIPDHEGQADLFDKLGKYTTGKGCVYVKKLDDVNAKTLAALLKRAVKLRRAASE